MNIADELAVHAKEELDHWDVQDMPLDNIDHIEVVRGPGGTIWGPNAANALAGC